ncbi:MAG: endonuclease MutS2 [Lachnospiraceae bacterium]|nr:endonuclease MutS2 [Lachnospiraceae bacterium]
MNDKVLHVLEFDRIIEKLESHASSERGKTLCRALRPYEDIHEIESSQTETEDALKRIFASGSISFSGIYDITRQIKTAEAGGALSPRELMNIASLLEAVSRIQSYGLDGEESPEDSLSDRFRCLSADGFLAKEIRRCILDEDTIADDASPDLKSIRRNLLLSQEKVHGTLQSLVNGSLKTYLMDTVITMRNNRYCVPVRSEYKSQVPGMVHDQSSSGSTLFIEPQAVVKLNNDIRELELKERAEIQEILRNLSLQCGGSAEAIIADYTILTELDFIFAKAKLAVEMNAVRPLMNTGEIIRLRGARHPLIDAKKVVPIDIRLGDEFDLLIITGPNTGGKTVSLKTVGLLELMGLSGLHIPALDRSELSFFREIYADIGDEQSIEQSLSTFSSHMTNIVAMLHDANITCLCLFDELGAGTDPTEGAALATSVLDYLHRRSIRTIATTHYSELKEYALTTSWVENACCEFDVESLRPTYRILVGVPGKSNAFAISKRLGLPDRIIEDAKKRISEEDEKFETLLSSLEQNRSELEKKKREISETQAEIQRLQQDLDTGRQKLEESRNRILSSAREEAKNILSEAKATADESLRKLQKYADGDTVRAAEQERTRIRESLARAKAQDGMPAPSESQIPEKDRTKSGLERKKARIGMDVLIVSLNLKGVIQTLPDKSGNLSVRCGIINYKVSLSDLAEINTGRTGYGIGSRKQVKGSSDSGDSAGVGSGLSKAMTIHTELKLIGMTADEAREALASYLDDAYLSHLDSVRIVHGKGSGVLREMVKNYLKNCKYVKEFRLGEYGEGDAGVTIVKFKNK